jgi:hypothetical protein
LALATLLLATLLLAALLLVCRCGGVDIAVAVLWWRWEGQYVYMVVEVAVVVAVVADVSGLLASSSCSTFLYRT